MRGKQIFRAIVLGVFVLSATTCQAEPELLSYLSFTVPGLIGKIKKIELADTDGDRLAEVLASDGVNVVLFSLSDGILLSHTLEPAVSAYEMALADVNRDSLVDATILIRRRPDSYYDLDIRYQVLFWDNVLSGVEPEIALDFSLQSTLGIGLLEAEDLNGDGYNDLILSVDSSYFDMEWFWSFGSDRSFGKTVYYHSFPDSVLADRDYMLTDLSLVNEPGVANRFVATSEHHSWTTGHGSADTEVSSSAILLLDPTGDRLDGTNGVNDASCYGSESNSFIDFLAVACTGNIASQTDRPGLIATYRWSRGCMSIEGGQPVYTGSSSREIVRYQVGSEDALVAIWQIKNDKYLSNFIAHSAFPDQFFALAGDTLLRFSSADGTLLKTYDPLPAGMKFWDYPYGGDDPYLVVVKRDTVTYFGFGAVTDIEADAANTLLPASFTLGQPYPNPFNPTVTLPLALKQRGHLRVEVINSLGQHVATPFDAVASAGEFDVTWDAGQFASGVYLFRATLDDKTKTVKAVLLK